MKYKIAYIDENDGWLNTFYQTLKSDFNIKRVKVIENSSVVGIVETLFETDLDAIVTDYLLEEEGNVSFNGNKIVEHVRFNRPHFPIIMLTSHESQAINHMDDVHIIYGKSILDGESDEELDLFISRVKSNIAHYYTKLDNTKFRIEELAKKRIDQGLEMTEEDELTRLFMKLDEFEPEGKDISSSLINTASISKLNEFVSQTREILEELKKARK